MRRAIIFLILLLIMFGIALAVYAAYYNNSQIAELIDMSSTDRMIKGDSFSGKFKYNTEGFYIKSFDYEISGDDLYITVFVGKSGDMMETDEDGYVLIEIEDLPEIDKVYYQGSEAKTVLTADR